MRPTLPYIKQKFDNFNLLCFDGKLPPITIVLSNARTYLGLCAFKTKRDKSGRRQHYDFRLRISTRFDLPEEEIEDTILHEMIHYAIALSNRKDTSTHGVVFRRIMDDLNSRFGRHISISHRITEEQRAEAAGKHPRHFVVALVRFADGRTGLKVIEARVAKPTRSNASAGAEKTSIVPAHPERIRTYRAGVTRVPEVSNVSFYASSNPFFERYPASAALKVYFTDEATIATALEGAQKLTP